MQTSSKMTATAALLVALALAPCVVRAEAPVELQQQFLDTMQRYLRIARQYVDLLGRNDGAMYFAVEGIVEVYEKRGHKADAAGHLQKILDANPGNQVLRNVVRFKLRDIFNETGQADRALAELDKVIEENRNARNP